MQNSNKFDVILAMTKNFGIGLNGILPWSCKDDLKIFKNKTLGHAIIVGRKTLESLPKLENRKIYCITRNSIQPNVNQDITEIKNINNILNLETDRKLFIAGGAEIYNSIFSNYINYIDTLHLSILSEPYNCDTYISNLNLEDWKIINKVDYEQFTHYELKYFHNGESQYLKLLKQVKNFGEEKIGRNGLTYSLFGNNLKFDLRNGFPLLTTKKMFIRGVIEELLFFIKGQTDTKILEQKNVNIWKGNTDRKFLDSIGMFNREVGIMGPMYGYQWRHFNAEYNEETYSNKEEGIDQLKSVIELIKNEPNSRRILLTTFNPSQVNKGVLYPCHSIIIQFNVSDSYLDIFCYNRSSDLLLGLPFNIASTSLLFEMIAKITNLIPRYFNLSLGDCHIYGSHLSAVSEQLSNIPYHFPKLVINKNLNSISDMEQLEYKDFEFKNYISHNVIKADMIA